MKLRTKIAAVGAGYVASFLVAWVAVVVRDAYVDPADLQASGGMYAFGDAMLFCAVFGVIALLPSGAALFFLRPYPRFWKTVSTLGVTVAVTGIAAVILYAVTKASPSSPFARWGAFSVLRLLAAPVFALGFLLCGFISPLRSARIAFFLATGIEVAVCLYFGVAWFLPVLFRE